MKSKLSAALSAAFALCGLVSPAYSQLHNLGFLYSGGSYTDIAPPGSSSSTSLAINDAGQVVGQYSSGASFYGYLYSGGSYTAPITQDSGPVQTTRAQDINASGQIVGGGLNFGFLYSG